MKTRDKDYIGRKVRLLYDVASRIHKVPKGTVCLVEGTWRGTFHLSTDPCPSCGVSVYVRQVPRHEIELIES